MGKLPFGILEDTPTSLSGYGITDAYTKDEVDEEFENYTPSSGSNAILATNIEIDIEEGIIDSDTTTSISITNENFDSNTSLMFFIDGEFQSINTDYTVDSDNKTINTVDTDTWDVDTDYKVVLFFITDDDDEYSSLTSYNYSGTITTTGRIDVTSEVEYSLNFDQILLFINGSFFTNYTVAWDSDNAAIVFLGDDFTADDTYSFILIKAINGGNSIEDYIKTIIDENTEEYIPPETFSADVVVESDERVFISSEQKEYLSEVMAVKGIFNSATTYTYTSDFIEADTCIASIVPITGTVVNGIASIAISDGSITVTSTETETYTFYLRIEKLSSTIIDDTTV